MKLGGAPRVIEICMKVGGAPWVIDLCMKVGGAPWVIELCIRGWGSWSLGYIESGWGSMDCIIKSGQGSMGLHMI